MQLRAYNNIGNTIARPYGNNLSISNFLVEAYILVFIFLFLSNATPFKGWGLSVFASAPLAFLGVMNFRKATPTLRFFCLTFVFIWAYEDIMTKVIGIKNISAIFATLFIVNYYQEMGEKGLNRLKNYIILFFLTSFLLFLGTGFTHTALVFRERVYAGLEAPFSMPNLFRGQGGLASTLFFFSYQVATGIGLFVGEYFLKSKIKKFFFLSCMVAIAALALMFSGERSPIIALAAVCFVLAFIRGKISKMIILGLILISIYIPFREMVNNLIELRNVTVIQRIMDDKKQEEAYDRITLQLWALIKIPQYPLGVHGHGASYSSIVGGANVEDRTSPHNGYITRTLLYGWFLLLIVYLVFHKVIKMILIVKREEFYETIPIIGGLIGTLINACFHNSSFLSFQPESLMLLMLFAGYFDYSLRKKSGYPRVGGLSSSITNGKTQ